MPIKKKLFLFKIEKNIFSIERNNIKKSEKDKTLLKGGIKKFEFQNNLNELNTQLYNDNNKAYNFVSNDNDSKNYNYLKISGNNNIINYIIKNNNDRNVNNLFNY